MNPDTITTFATPVIAPLIVAGIKKLLPKLPTWFLPTVFAPALGIIAGVIDHYATGGHLPLYLGAILGVAGVGIREAVDQTKQIVVGKTDS